MATPPLVIPGAWLVTISGTCQGTLVENVIGISNPGTPVATTSSIANDVGNAWKAAGGPLSKASYHYTFTNVRVVDLSTATGPVSDQSFSQQGGQSLADISTMASCALISWNGGTRGRRTSGRMYFGPLQEGNIQVNGRSLDAAYQTGLQTAITQFHTQIGVAGLEWVTLSRAGLSYASVGTPTVQSTIATQRRRLRR